jgi:hypothetical protein
MSTIPTIISTATTISTSTIMSTIPTIISTSTI